MPAVAAIRRLSRTPINSRSDRRSDWPSWSWDSRQIWSPTWTRLSITTTEVTGPQLSAHLVVFVGMALVLIGVVIDGVRSGRRSWRHAQLKGGNLDAIR